MRNQCMDRHLSWEPLLRTKTTPILLILTVLALEHLLAPRTLRVPINKHAPYTQWEPKDGRQDTRETKPRLGDVAELETLHLGVVRREERVDTVLGDWVDVVVDCYGSCLG